VQSQITDTKALEMEGQTAKRVAIAKKKLEQAKVKNFFEYIVDPESYSQTVENLFHLSFLVRNGMYATGPISLCAYSVLSRPSLNARSLSLII
jgi:hypothetical protein